MGKSKSKRIKWTPELDNQIKSLAAKGLTNKQISEEMGLDYNKVQNRCRHKKFRSRNYLNKITKHKELRKPVFTYFLNHTYEETRKHFGLTNSEIKSIFTVGYRIDELKHLRKDTRCKRRWTTEEIIYLIRRIGLIEFKIIGQALGRGEYRVIKEKCQSLGLKAKTTHGMTLSSYRKHFNQEPTLFVQTKAGPRGGKNRNGLNFKLVPWVVLQDEIKQKQITTPKIIKTYIETMALFQNFIYDGQPIEMMRRIIAEGK